MVDAELVEDDLTGRLGEASIALRRVKVMRDGQHRNNVLTSIGEGILKKLSMLFASEEKVESRFDGETVIAGIVSMGADVDCLLIRGRLAEIGQLVVPWKEWVVWHS